MTPSGDPTFSSLPFRFVIAPARLEPEEEALRIEGSTLSAQVRDWCDDPAMWPQMLRLYEEISGESFRGPSASELEQRIVPALQSWFESGRLLGLSAQPLPSLQRDEDGVHHRVEADQPANAPPKGPPRRISEKTFLDVTVIYEDGTPVVGQPYKVQFPDGLSQTGKLASDGHLGKTNIDPGTAILTLLKPSGDVVQASEIPTGDQPSFVEILLLDENGTPLSGTKYEITLPDGSVQTGTLDDQGTATWMEFRQATAT